ncbi:MAG: AMP-binding protein [Actinomycetota bacterium]
MGRGGHLPSGPGDLVAVALPPGPAWIDVLADLWADGAAILPLDPRLAASETRAIMGLARPGALLTAEGVTALTETDGVDPGVGLVLATSGTGGLPRVVELSRGAVEAAVLGSTQALGDGPDGRWLCCLPVAHVGGMLILMRGLLTAAPVEVHPQFDPAAVATADADHVSLVPTMLHRLLTTGVDLTRFRAILVGGGAIDDATRRSARDRGARVVATYGLTESAGGVAYDGQLFEGSAARIGPGGEVHLAGPTLMSGYRGDPSSTSAAFTLDGWLRTGDAGTLGDDGRLRVHGRLDDCILTGAEKVWPQEVEDALRRHPKVHELAVAGRPDPEWGQHVVAFVVPTSLDDPPTLEELRDHAAERIARFKMPRELVMLPALPRTPSGKIRRGELR